jgi:alpha-pyrone synthase
MDSFRSVLIPETRDLITWRIRGVGFDMLLSGKVPGEIGKALAVSGGEVLGVSKPEGEISLWGVHPGGKSVLDAVERGLGLAKDALAASRQTLECFGNMSSATVMFVMERLMQMRSPEKGCAMSFGPGLTAETMLFHAV